MVPRDPKEKEFWQTLREHLEAVLEITPLALALVDTDYRIQWANQELTEIFGRCKDEILSRPCYEVFHETESPPENCLIRQIIQSPDPQPRCLNEVLRGKNLKICAVPLQNEGHLLGALHFVLDLSEVHQLREDLLEKETILQSLLDAYPDIIVFKDQELRWKLANRATLRTFGIREDEWQGRTDLELAERHPEFREVFQYCHLTDRMALKKKGLSRSLEEVPLNGEVRIYDVVKIPVFQNEKLKGLLVIGHDITPLKRTHLKIKEYANRLRTLLDGLPLGVIFVSPEGRIFEVNRKFCEIYGYRPEEVIGKRGRFLFPDEETWENFMQEMLQAIAEKGSYETEILQRRKDGTLFPLRALGRRLENRGRIWIVEDITAQKEAEQRTKQLERSLEQARRLESLAVLTGAVAHDFNNLLTIILGRAQLLNQKVSQIPGAQRDVEIIIEACERAQHLVQQMLTFSGHQISEETPFDLNQLLKHREELIQELARPGVEIVFDLAPELPPILGDPAKIEQALINLVENAVEAVGKGGLVRISTALVEVSRLDLTRAIVGYDLPEGRYVALIVEDNGAGIPEEKIHKIFDPFFSTKEFGRGLGLASVLGIVRAHHGALLVESKPGQGTRFTLLFPLAS